MISHISVESYSLAKDVHRMISYDSTLFHCLGYLQIDHTFTDRISFRIDLTSKYIMRLTFYVPFMIFQTKQLPE